MKKTLSYKEKKRAFNALKSPSMASFDLELLKKLCPEHPELSRFMLKPSRCADDILFCLLEFATEKEIRQNREKMQLTHEPLKCGNGVCAYRNTPACTEENRKKCSNFVSVLPDMEQNQPKTDLPDTVIDAESRASEAEERVDEAEKRAEEAEERAEDAETRAEVAEERAEAAEQALADEKKKEA